jgi:hypothetical protein
MCFASKAVFLRFAAVYCSIQKAWEEKMKTEEPCIDLNKDYKKSIGYPEDNTYLKGNPIKVHIPVETALNKVMIGGAYPSARFFTVQGPKGKITNTPLSGIY